MGTHALDKALDKEFPQINGSGTPLFSRTRVLSELERYDLGWFVACLCTPLLGEDSPSTSPATAPAPFPRARPTATSRCTWSSGAVGSRR